jgi:hypothetical protein
VKEGGVRYGVTRRREGLTGGRTRARRHQVGRRAAGENRGVRFRGHSGLAQEERGVGLGRKKRSGPNPE